MVDVGHAFSQAFRIDLVPILVPKVGRFSLSALDLSARIGDEPGADAADGGREVEEVGDRGRVEQLVGHFALGDDADAVAASDRYGRLSRVGYRFEGVLC